jgi:uncharacterized protein YciI/predicted GNAT family acetyltransferase
MMMFVIHALDKPGALNVRLAHYDAHKAFLADPSPHGVRIVISGPLTADEGTTMIGSLFLVEASNRASVESFNQADPFHDAGIWEHVTITGFQRRQGPDLHAGSNRSMTMDDSVVENPEAHRFEMTIGDAVAAAYYRLNDGNVVLTHTEVPQQLSGRGIGSKLAAGVFRLLRESGRKAVVRCSFMAAWVSRHPEVSDLVVG